LTTQIRSKDKVYSLNTPSNIVAKNLHFISKCTNVLANNKHKIDIEGVSAANIDARTQMAQAKENRLAGRLLGAGLALSAAFVPAVATAQDVMPVANTVENARTAEISELRAADRAATAYAKEHGVAILLHVGKDIQNHEQPEALLQWVENQFKDSFSKYGIKVGIFPSMNDAKGSGLTYHIGDHIYSPPGSNGLFDLQTASEIVPEVVEQAKIALELAKADINVLPASQPGG
jgi:hypothetical protein